MRSIPGRNRLRAALVIVLLTALTAGCFNSSTGSVKGGSLAQGVSLRGATFTVGSKEFTEQLVLCYITILALRSVGATIREKCGLQGTDIARAALRSGSIDMYWEYTGTAWTKTLNHPKPIEDPIQQYNAVALEDLTKNHVKWLEPSWVNDTYAIGTRHSTGIKTISEFARLVNNKPSDASMCVASEFSRRSDGLPGVERVYGFKVTRGHLATFAEDDIYDAINKGDPCDFGEVSTTDGRITHLNLTILRDDKKFFPIYNPALIVRENVYNDHPDLAKIAATIVDALTKADFRRLNGEVDVGGKDPRQVAQEWLKAKGFIGT